jgi:hypothetical protein
MNALAHSISNEAAIFHIRELGMRVAELERQLKDKDHVIASYRERLEEAVPLDEYKIDLREVYGGNWDIPCVPVPESVFVEASKQLRNRHANEFDELIHSNYRLDQAEASKP